MAGSSVVFQNIESATRCSRVSPRVVVHVGHYLGGRAYRWRVSWRGRLSGGKVEDDNARGQSFQRPFSSTKGLRPIQGGSRFTLLARRNCAPETSYSLRSVRRMSKVGIGA